MPNPHKQHQEDKDLDKKNFDYDDEDKDDDEDQDQDDDDQDEDYNDEDDDGNDDDHDDDEDDDEDEDDEKISVSEYRKLQKASTKGTQKLIQVNKAYKYAMENLSQVADDPKKLLDIYKNNPDSAQVILDHYYEWISIAEFKKNVLKISQQDWLTEDDIERMYDKIEAKKNAQKNQKIVNSKVEKMLSEIDPKVAKSVKREYDEIVEWKDVSPDKVQKYFKLAYYEVVGEKLSDDISTKYIKNSSPGKWSSWKWSTFKDRESSAINESLWFLEEMWVLKKNK